MILGPLTYVGFAGCLALGALAGIQTVKANHAHEVLANERSEYANRIAQAEHASAQTEAKYRTRERDMQAEVEVLRIHVDEANAALLASSARADASAISLRRAKDSYATAQASRAATDPATACAINAASAAMFEQLHRETDDFAQFAAGQADSIAAQVMFLQHYVRDVCHN